MRRIGIVPVAWKVLTCHAAMTRLVWTPLLVLLGAPSCGKGHPPADGGPPPDGGAGPMQFVERLERAQDFSALQGEGWSVKYLGAVGGRKPPAVVDRRCIFQNTALYPLHVQFLRSFPQLAQPRLRHLPGPGHEGRHARVVGRRAAAGSGGEHPAPGARAIMAAFVYADPDDPVGLDSLVAIDARLKECAPYARDLWCWWRRPGAGARLRRKADALAARGVPVVDLATLRPVVGAEGYSLGEGTATCAWFPAASARASGARATSWSARVRTTIWGWWRADHQLAAEPAQPREPAPAREDDPQRAHSRHLRKPGVLLLEGKLAHLTVMENEARLESAHLEDAEAFWASRRPPVRPLTGDLTEQRLQDFSELRATGAPAYGVKAANLGELHQVLPAENRAEGFGIPYSVYRDFRDGTDVGARITAFLADPRTTTDAAFRRSGLAELQAAILAAPLPAGLLDRLRQAARQAFGEGYATQPLKFRSSSNAEDGEVSTGAGLYDSARGCFADDDDGDENGPSACLSADERARLDSELNRRLLEWSAFPERNWISEIVNDLKGDLNKERSVARALRKVFASLWNERAFEERAYFGMNHADVLMGVAVNGSFVLEQLDAVVLTNLPVTEGAPLTRVVSQRDGNPRGAPGRSAAGRRGDDLSPRRRRSGDRRQDRHAVVAVAAAAVGRASSGPAVAAAGADPGSLRPGRLSAASRPEPGPGGQGDRGQPRGHQAGPPVSHPGADGPLRERQGTAMIDPIETREENA